MQKNFERVRKVRPKVFVGIITFILMALLVQGSIGWADGGGDPHAGHDMSTMDHSGGSHNLQESEDHSQHSTVPDNPPAGFSGTHEQGHDGHGQETPQTEAPPNWTLLYGFGALNLLVILTAFIMKKTSAGNGVN
ncbi:hypothetical protein Desru_0498 [Desulforamulus ruminis DSM 2154]|uniref:Uncharacterized protein n=1 Tax=Desulforamulus ruminis (strain ATCC 23193 / DSM 2154 / NCIMB 8452 / DL) TaxID=696281 RepID=F6DS22_DESRL|nr:hypothetical protein Desru_0498 [Desulforamulus ruminis DSM 2154]